MQDQLLHCCDHTGHDLLTPRVTPIAKQSGFFLNMGWRLGVTLKTVVPQTRRDTLALIARMTETSKIDHLISIPDVTSDDAEQVTDDWSDLSDPTERRRRQNRINQRAYRMSLPPQFVE